jgi:Glycosyltransferase family 87
VGRTSPWLVFGLPAAICAAWTVYAGKDVNWDQLNYHYYLPFELLAGRLGQDFFAASAQSYLNPVGYLPFYLMVAHGWHSVAVSIVLATAHSLSIGLLYLVAYRLFAHLPPRDRSVFSCLATALGAATGVYWMTVGGSFLDPLLVPPMLAALLLLLRGERHAGRRAALAGALFGAAAALKYSNAVYALAALPLALAMPGLAGASRLRACFAYVLGAAVAVGLLAGPWFALLTREFGNPVFPLLNAWFRSPHALQINMISERFALSDPIALLAFPFRMVTLDPNIYSENFAPDLRFAALFVTVAGLAALAARRGTPAAGALRGADWRVLAFFASALALWLASSANGRYGMVVLLLAGVCLARVVERLLPARDARVALAVLLAVQIGISIIASPPRWFISEAWSARWLPFEVPERALRDPALYLTVEILPMAVIAPFVHPASSFMNFRGQHSLPTGSPRLTALLERHRGHVRVLGRELELVEGKPAEHQVKSYDTRLRRIGYRVDPADCFAIPWRPDDDDVLSRAANWLAGGPRPHEPLSVVSCGLRTATRDPADVERERQVSVLFDRMEKTCPRLFRGQTSVTEPLGSGWSRYYAGLDARLEAYGRRVILNRYRADVQVDLGLLSDWERAEATLPAACR